MNVTRFIASIQRFRSSATRRSPQQERHIVSLKVDRMSLDEKKALFTGEGTRLYNMISENHRQPEGPWPIMVQAVKDEMMRAANPKILELATGPGEPAASIARAFPNAEIIATDISDDMIVAARATCVAIPNMVAEKADMMDLGNYADDTFDIVTCCYGFMFPPDKDLALQETYCVLKPNGGVLITTVWNDLPTMRLIREIMEGVSGEDVTPPPPPVNPMTLSEPGLFEGMVEQAGFTDVQVSAHDYNFNFGSDADLVFKQVTMPVMAVLDEIDGAWDTAREVFEAEKLNYGKYDADENYVIGENVYTLLIAKT